MGAGWAVAGEVAGGLISDVLGLAQAYNQRQFIREQRSTAHQVEVEDLRRAGLNPILSVMGRGAQVAPGTIVQPDNPARGLAQNIINARMVDTQIKKGEAEAAASNAQAKNFESQSEVNSALSKKIDAERSKTEFEWDVIEQMAKREASQAEVNSALRQQIEYQNEERRAESELYKGKAGKYIKGTEKILDKITPLLNPLNRIFQQNK